MQPKSLKTQQKFSLHDCTLGRIGHRIIRIANSILIFGGVDFMGNFIGSVQAINTEAGLIDTLLTDNLLLLESFALFCFSGVIYLWGGNRYNPINQTIHSSNQLLLFDGERFTVVAQKGILPNPRSNHSFVVFAQKYLVIFGGLDGSNPLTDWHVFNLQTFTWHQLDPSFQVPLFQHSAMCWIDGKGILVLNEIFEKVTESFSFHRVYEFRVTDFNRFKLKLTLLSVDLEANGGFTIENMCCVDAHNLLMMGGHHLHNLEPHNFSWIYNTALRKFQRLSIVNFKPSSLFQSIYIHNKLYLVGGYLGGKTLRQGYETVDFSPAGGEKGHFTRHVCVGCEYFYDQEIFYKSPQAISTLPRQEHDYRYFLKMDNKVLAKFASAIETPFMAVILLIECFQFFNPSEIQLSLTKLSRVGDNSTFKIISTGCYRKLTLRETVQGWFLLKENLLEKSIHSSILSLKLAGLRLGPSCLYVSETKQGSTFVVYFSCSTTDSPENILLHTNCLCYSIVGKDVSDSSQRKIIFDNLLHIFSCKEDYEHLGGKSMAFYVLEAASLCPSQQAVEKTKVTTKYSIYHSKSCDKNLDCLASFFKIAFLPTPSFPRLKVNQRFVEMGDIFAILSEHAQTHEIDPLNEIPLSKEEKQIVLRVKLYVPYDDFFLNGVLLYCRKKLVGHWINQKSSICGAIELQEDLALSLGRSSLENLHDEACLRNYLAEATKLKRSLS